MPQIDLLLAAELVVALLLVATLDSSPAPEAPQAAASVSPPWNADNDIHAQRILRLERRRCASTGPQA
jgi:hypothetical protein